MRSAVFLALAVTLVVAAPADSGAEADRPDGRLVLGVARVDPAVGAYSKAWAVLADPRTGTLQRRRIDVSGLCRGPVVTAEGRIGRFEPRAERRLQRSAGALVRARLGGRRVLAWSPSHRWLYFSGSDRRLLAWRAGTNRIVALPIRPGGDVLSAVAVH